jgi:hypothetical protein
MVDDRTDVQSVDSRKSLQPDPIQYELRIGVTGHRDLANPGDVEAAVRALLRDLVKTFEQASADPLGPHGSPQARIDRFDRWLTRVLAAGTRVVAFNRLL